MLAKMEVVIAGLEDPGDANHRGTAAQNVRDNRQRMLHTEQLFVT